MDARDARSMYLNPLLGESSVVNVPHIKMNADEGTIHIVEKRPEFSRRQQEALLRIAIFTTDPYLRVCSAHLKPRNVTEPELDAIVSCLLYEFESLLEAPTLRNHVVADRFFHGTSFMAPLFNRTWQNSEASKTSFEGLHGNLLLKATDILEAGTCPESRQDNWQQRRMLRGAKLRPDWHQSEWPEQFLQAQNHRSRPLSAGSIVAEQRTIPVHPRQDRTVVPRHQGLEPRCAHQVR